MRDMVDKMDNMCDKRYVYKTVQGMKGVRYGVSVIGVL